VLYWLSAKRWRCYARLQEDGSLYMPGAEYQVDLIINSNYKFIDIGHDVVKYLCNLIGFDEDTTHWIILAVREGISNAIKHGNKLDEDKKVCVRMIYQDSTLEIEIEDEGEGFDPTKVENPLLPENLLKATGRGIFYMNSFMDSVGYKFKKKNHGTILQMKKILQRV
jgi:serine/threonine-protein kinase RsbW